MSKKKMATFFITIMLFLSMGTISFAATNRSVYASSNSQKWNIFVSTPYSSSSSTKTLQCPTNHQCKVTCSYTSTSVSVKSSFYSGSPMYMNSAGQYRYVQFENVRAGKLVDVTMGITSASGTASANGFVYY